MNQPFIARRLMAFLALFLLIVGTSASSWALISGPMSLQTGFPLWYEDEAGNRMEICLNPACIPEPVTIGDSFSEQIGFGAEAFFWTAGALVPAGATPPGLVLVEFAMEAAWAAEVPNKGDWFPFTRIRIRLDTDLPGDYTIAHPFGTVGPINVPAANALRGVNVSLDIPAGAPPGFEILPDPGNVPSEFFAAGGVPFVPGEVFIGVGPLTASPTLLRTDVLITGPAGSALNMTMIDFDSAGRYFEHALTPRPNLPPVATPDIAGVLFGSSGGVVIDAVANDLDVIALGTNDHGINPKATALGAPDPLALVELANFPLGTLEMVPDQPVLSANGASVIKNSDGTFTYMPSATFAGEDTFTYTVQDTGGLVASETVTIQVENLTLKRATVRIKTMKWEIAGETTVFAVLPTPHIITLHAGPTAAGPVIGTASVKADGSWMTRGDITDNPQGMTTITCVSSVGAVLAGRVVTLR